MPDDPDLPEQTSYIGARAVDNQVLISFDITDPVTGVESRQSLPFGFGIHDIRGIGDLVGGISRPNNMGLIAMTLTNDGVSGVSNRTTSTSYPINPSSTHIVVGSLFSTIGELKVGDDFDSRWQQFQIGLNNITTGARVDFNPNIGMRVEDGGLVLLGSNSGSFLDALLYTTSETTETLADADFIAVLSQEPNLSLINEQSQVGDNPDFPFGLWGANVDLVDGQVFVGAPGSQAVAVYDLTEPEYSAWQVNVIDQTFLNPTDVVFDAPTRPSFIQTREDLDSFGDTLSTSSAGLFFVEGDAAGSEQLHIFRNNGGWAEETPVAAPQPSRSFLSNDFEILTSAGSLVLPSFVEASEVNVIDADTGQVGVELTPFALNSSTGQMESLGYLQDREGGGTARRRFGADQR
ncbi:MAG: hypothetical protein ACC645_17480 [Pirellulales bacterium]